MEATTTKNKGGRPKKLPVDPNAIPTLTPKQEIALNRATYKKSLYEFFKDAFPHIQGHTYEDMWHIENLCNEKLQPAGERLAQAQPRDKHYDVNIPPRTGKSVLINVIYPIWLWILRPNLDIVSISNAAENAKDFVGDSMKVMTSEWFKAHYPELALVTNTTLEYTNSFGGKRRGYGIKAKILGINADVILIDDVMDTDTAESDADREYVLKKLSKTVLGRMYRKDLSLVINIQQRIHVEDFSGWLMKHMGKWYERIKLPSEATSADQVSPQEWFQYYTPEGLMCDKVGRGDRDTLEQDLSRIGTLAYAQQYLQEPRSREGGLFKMHWFEGQNLGYPEFQKKFATRNLEWQVFVDGAETDKPKNDPTCFMLCCKVDNNLYIKEVSWVRLEFTDLVEYTKNYIKRWEHTEVNIIRFRVEDKSIGTQLIDVIRKTNVNIPFVPLSTNNDPKYVRATRATPFVEGRKLWLINDRDSPEPWNNKFIAEVTDFTNGKGKKHDDALDCMAYAIEDAKTSDVWFKGRR